MQDRTKSQRPAKTNSVCFTGREYLQKGFRCLQSGAYFEAHEFWEIPWQEMRPPYRAFWQALIQLSVGAYHLQNKNLNGCRSLWNKALRHCQALQNAPDEIPICYLHQLLRCIEKSLAELPDAQKAFRHVEQFSSQVPAKRWAELCRPDLLERQLPL